MELLNKIGELLMLILTRRIGETVIIGDNIKVTALNIERNQIRLGIDAPKTVSVHREEVFERIKAEELINSVQDQTESTS